MHHLGSSISSTKSDNVYIGKIWIPIDRLLPISNLISNKIKLDFFQVIAMSILLYGHNTWILMKRLCSSHLAFYPNDAACRFKQILEVAVWLLTPILRIIHLVK